ncbi:unnamed protein product, partial [Ixodes pacificus]
TLILLGELPHSFFFFFVRRFCLFGFLTPPTIYHSSCVFVCACFFLSHTLVVTKYLSPFQSFAIGRHRELPLVGHVWVSALCKLCSTVHLAINENRGFHSVVLNCFTDLLYQRHCCLHVQALYLHKKY